MIVYSILALGFPLSEIEMRTNIMGNIGLDRYPYHEQQRKPYHCFPGQHKQREWEFFDKPSYTENQVLESKHSHRHAL